MNLDKCYSIVLDDDPIIHRIIGQSLSQNALPFVCPKKLLAKASSYKPSAVFVDIGLGENISGLDYISHFRKIWPYTPIIVVSAEDQGEAIGKALALGANDYVKKPISPEELRARVHARTTEMHTKTRLGKFVFGDLSFDSNIDSLTCNGKSTFLPRLEARMFKTLAQNGGMEVPKSVLRGKIWGDLKVSSNALDKKISGLRSYLRDIGSTVKVKSAYKGGVYLEFGVEKKLKLTA